MELRFATSKKQNVSPKPRDRSDHLLQIGKYSHYQTYRLLDLSGIIFETKIQKDYVSAVQVYRDLNSDLPLAFP